MTTIRSLLPRPSILVCLTVLLNGCADDFLDVRSDLGIATPSSVADYRAMLDLSSLYGNNGYILSIPATDEFYVETPVYQALPLGNYQRQQKNAYLWLPEIYENEEGLDWNSAYSKILTVNLVLDGLKKIDAKEEGHAPVKGTALFLRAFHYYQLAQLFAPPYDPVTAGQDLGIPLRLEADVTIPSKRASVQDTYARILADLGESLQLLPDKPVGNKRKPSKAAVHALMARVLLLMDDHGAALAHALLSRGYEGSLLDYAGLHTDQNFPFKRDHGSSNPEVLFFAYTRAFNLLHDSRMHIDPRLESLYDAGDIRRSVYFKKGAKGNVYFRGSLEGSNLIFCGLTTAETLLIAAECHIRTGRPDQAAGLLDELRRYRSGQQQWEPLVWDDKDDLLQYCLEERQRELCFRGLRWEDLRRLNKDARFAKTLVRQVAGETYVLEPNDLRYVWPIPNSVVQLTGMEQNDR
ncbi:RagB/SusD family nutrient uptake outer membrane protein [Sphingobacterium sp. SYP-B4668]|uniref:RagB/SusD family nutrient uptake outer membrane protein n=1 Tax=Sphingobacterium sp. SYP-B4668 TaxID=2996035 RepID=UPI0022DD827A|nr:RagB/SusD family nutrient uptake outer membrane protein [Sphingobacterium sp. SYP-B4668]